MVSLSQLKMMKMMGITSPWTSPTGQLPEYVLFLLHLLLLSLLWLH